MNPIYTSNYTKLTPTYRLNGWSASATEDVTILAEEDLMAKLCIARGSRICGRQRLYTCYNTVDRDGIGVEGARIAIFSGNEYVGVDSD